MSLLSAIKSSIPQPVKRVVRQMILDPLHERISDRELKRCLGELRDASTVDRSTIDTLRSAWGNEGFSATSGLIAEVAHLVVEANGPILECGTGITTLVAGVLAERRNAQVLSLEQDADWAAHINRALSRFGVRNVEVHYTPLRQYGEY